MDHSEATAAVSIALALAAGMIAQAVARHLRVPGIVVLLGTGVLLGPDVLQFIDPQSLGSAVHVLVGFAVAIILFEGGMNLNIKRLRQSAGVIQRLLTIGVVVTGAGATLAARLALGWDWPLAASFGSLVIVTGPTVITPLLRRIKVRHTVETVLEAEGVLIDPIGAVLAIVTLQIVVGSSVALSLLHVLQSLGFGLILGLAGGSLLAFLLRIPRLVPEGYENVFTLSLVLALYQVSNLALSESGIMTVTAAGIVVGNVRTRVQRDLMEFKEQLTVLMIGMLFVLLAADVRLVDLQALGWPGMLTVAALMVVVRPLNVALSTWRTALTVRERLFLSWLAPRGVVAAAVATLFAQTFDTNGISGGKQLQALVFMVIGATVVIQGLSGGIVAGLLKLRRPPHLGYAILGANPIGQAVGRLLRMAGKEVIFIDSNPLACKSVEEDGFRVVFGNVHHERTLMRAQLHDRAAVLALTANEEVNLLFARSAVEEFKVPFVFVAVRRDRLSVNPEIVKNAGAQVLFGIPRDLENWVERMHRNQASVESWKLVNKPAKENDVARYEFPRFVLPLVVQRGKQAFPANAGEELTRGDVVHFAIVQSKREEAEAWLGERDWRMVETLDKNMPVAGVAETPSESASRA